VNNYDYAIVLLTNIGFFCVYTHNRLNLPGKVEQTDDSSAKYDADESKFIIRLDKMTPGEVFPNLNMLVTFLKPKENKKRKPMIQVLESGNDEHISVF
jgi:protein SHQ1